MWADEVTDQKWGRSDTSILHHAFISIFIALWYVITHYISILMAILSYFTRLTMKRGNAGSWNSGWKRSKHWKPILHSSKNLQTPGNLFLELIRIIERKKYIRGPTPCPGGWGGAPPVSWAPWWAPVSIFCYMRAFTLEKSVGKHTGRNSAATRRNLGGRAPAELFCGGHFPLGAGNHHQRHHQRSSHPERVNLHQHIHQHHLLSKP